MRLGNLRPAWGRRKHQVTPTVKDIRHRSRPSSVAIPKPFGCNRVRIAVPSRASGAADGPPGKEVDGTRESHTEAPHSGGHVPGRPRAGNLRIAPDRLQLGDGKDLPRRAEPAAHEQPVRDLHRRTREGRPGNDRITAEQGRQGHEGPGQGGGRLPPVRHRRACPRPEPLGLAACPDRRHLRDGPGHRHGHSGRHRSDQAAPQHLRHREDGPGRPRPHAPVPRARAREGARRPSPSQPPDNLTRSRRTVRLAFGRAPDGWGHPCAKTQPNVPSRAHHLGRRCHGGSRQDEGAFR